jgi:hypothetical protein
VGYENTHEWRIKSAETVGFDEGGPPTQSVLEVLTRTKSKTIVWKSVPSFFYNEALLYHNSLGFAASCNCRIMKFLHLD